MIEIIAGPTGAGKSARALARAAQTNGVIINVDSRQIYNALPILSAQPDEEERMAAPHELYGVLHPNDICSAGRWREFAMPVISRLLAEGRTPIVTGGTGLYIKTLIEGISPIPHVPDDIRARAIQTQKEMGNPAFHAALAKRDPETAALYHPMHTARLIHAWEVLEASGKPLVHWQSLPKDRPPEDWMFDITLVLPDRETLTARCAQRFRAMMERGAMEELAAFDARISAGEINTASPTLKTIGINALRAYREGRISYEEAVALAVTETRQYAKRQTTWFKNQIAPRPGIRAIEITKG